MAAVKKKTGGKKASGRKVAGKKVSRKKTTRSKATRKTSTRSKATRKKVGRPKGSGKKRGASLARLTTTALAAELARRERRLPALERERAALLAKLDAVEAEIAGIGGAAKVSRGGRKSPGRPVGSGAGRKRPRNAKNLEDSLADTLRGKTMSVTEATAAVKARGYKTTAANFRTIVNATLLKSKKIRKVSRGKYTAK